ncbi:MAG: hypothetical protein V7K48_13530 [Nostoc sp.]|uniref:hypothetical protein n=1 Tax=Nostoc sp. TaxID=1180 RepID=UPI002FFC2735
MNTTFRVSISKGGYISLNDQLRNSKRLIINSMRSPFLFLRVLCASAVACGKPLRVYVILSTPINPKFYTKL